MNGTSRNAEVHSIGECEKCQRNERIKSRRENDIDGDVLDAHRCRDGDAVQEGCAQGFTRRERTQRQHCTHQQQEGAAEDRGIRFVLFGEYI